MKIGLKPHSNGILFSKLIFLIAEENLFKLKIINEINITIIIINYITYICDYYIFINIYNKSYYIINKREKSATNLSKF